MRKQRYIYKPGFLDRFNAIVIQGEPIRPGSEVIIDRNEVDPHGKLVWIRDASGNVQSVYWSSLTTKKGA